ncbi:MAG TPA: hypothetical protein VMN03_03890 [Burkholderiales bacterium]|nr:hypothetical protein [Burkholderiales bacterium]
MAGSEVNTLGDGLSAVVPLCKIMYELISRFSISPQSRVLASSLSPLRAAAKELA